MDWLAGGWVLAWVGAWVSTLVSVWLGGGRFETGFLAPAVVLPPPVLQRPTGRPPLVFIHLTQTG